MDYTDYLYGGIGIGFVMLVLVLLRKPRLLQEPVIQENYDCYTRTVQFRKGNDIEDDPTRVFAVAIGPDGGGIPNNPLPYEVTFMKISELSFVTTQAGGIPVIGTVTPSTPQDVVVWTEVDNNVGGASIKLWCDSGGSGSGSGYGCGGCDDDEGGGGGGGRPAGGGRGKFRMAPREYELAFGPPLDTDAPWVAGVDRRGNVPLAYTSPLVQGVAGVWRGRVNDVTLELEVRDTTQPLSAELRVTVPANGVPGHTVRWTSDAWFYTGPNRLVVSGNGNPQNYPQVVVIAPRPA